MKKKNEMDVVFILDKSGSMGGYENDTIGGYNSYLDKVKKKKSKVYVTTVLFNNGYELLNEREEISKVNHLTEEDYKVGGCTALYDAIGKTIEIVDKYKSDKVLFVITTDGLENASIEYNKNTIKKLIESHKNIEFIYLGANIDSYAEGSSIGIKRESIANYKQDKKGFKMMFDAIGCATEELSESACLSSNWKEKLDDYIDNNI